MSFKKFIQRIFLFEKIVIKTKSSPHNIARNVNLFADPKGTNYYGRADEKGFFVGQKHRIYNGGIRINNSFAPVARGRITELSDNEREVTVTLRMHAAVLVLFMPMYIASLITLILFPFAYLLAYIGFVRPSRKLKDAIINIVSDDVPHSYHEEDEEQKIN
jgi:hypothetical protein